MQRARELLCEAVKEYEPAAQMHDLVWAMRQAPAAAPEPMIERRTGDAVVRLVRAVPRTEL